MKRPLFWSGLIIPCAMVVAFSFEGAALWLGCGAVLVALLSVAIRKKHSVPCALAFIAFAIGCIWSGLYWELKLVPFDGLQGDKVVVEGTVIECQMGESGNTFLVKGSSPTVADGQKTVWQFYLRGDEPPAAGTIIRCTGTVYSLGAGEEYSRYLLSKRVGVRGYSYEAPLVLGVDSSLSGRLAALRDGWVKKSLRIYPHKEAGIVAAMLFGHRENLDDALYQDLKYSGLAHTVAISGLHLLVITQLVLGCLLKKGFEGRMTNIITVLLVWLLAFLGGLNPPVVRSALIATIMGAGYFFGRVPDSRNSLGFSAIVILLHNPLAVWSLSFQATFLSCLGLIVLAPPLTRWWKGDEWYRLNRRKKFKNWLGEGIIVGFTTQIFLIPILYLSFGYISFGFILSSPLVLPILPAVIGLSYLSVLLPTSITAPLIHIVVLLLRYFAQMAHWIADLPLLVYGNHWFLFPWAIGAVIAGIWLWRKRPGRWITGWTACFLIGSLLIASMAATWMEGHTVRVLWIPQEETVIVTRQHRAVVLGLGKESSKTVETLQRFRVKKLDYLLLPDSAFTQSTQAADLIRIYQPAYLSALETGVTDSYLSHLPIGERVEYQRQQVELLGCMLLELSPNQEIRLQIGDATVLKYLDLYDIIKESGSGLSLTLPSIGPAQLENLPARSRLGRTPEGAWMLLLPTD